MVPVQQARVREVLAPIAPVLQVPVLQVPVLQVPVLRAPVLQVRARMAPGRLALARPVRGRVTLNRRGRGLPVRDGRVLVRRLPPAPALDSRLPARTPRAWVRVVYRRLVVRIRRRAVPRMAAHPIEPPRRARTHPRFPSGRSQRARRPARLLEAWSAPPTKSVRPLGARPASTRGPVRHARQQPATGSRRPTAVLDQTLRAPRTELGLPSSRARRHALSAESDAPQRSIRKSPTTSCPQSCRERREQSCGLCPRRPPTWSRATSSWLVG
jgi:hypothetical protein